MLKKSWMPPSPILGEQSIIGSIPGTIMSNPVKYRGTVTGLLISAVDGTAFIDNANASITALADGNHQIEVYDSTGKFIRGVLSSQGAGETLGSELVTNGDFATDIIGWDDLHIGTGSISWDASGKMLLTRADGSNNGRTSQDIGASPGKCYKISLTINNNFQFRWYYPTTSPYYCNMGPGNNEIYVTGENYSHIWFIPTTSDTLLDDVSVKQVLTPSTSGAVIVSAKGGAVENWAYKDASFAYNAASYYVIVKEMR